MKKNYHLLLFILLIFSIPDTLDAEVPDKPNIVFIFADDMGYGDVSVNNHFARTSTPAIDKLAEEG
jgi:arylsulfatase A